MPGEKNLKPQVNGTQAKTQGCAQKMDRSHRCLLKISNQADTKGSQASKPQRESVQPFQQDLLAMTRIKICHLLIPYKESDDHKKRANVKHLTKETTLGRNSPCI